ncbi:MAG TPA: hypothetical protein VNA16_01540 [Abditibacteriaceae bacterium]|nr:hypothetical protein [Abditibacteriaceae bacterium]
MTSSPSLPLKPSRRNWIYLLLAIAATLPWVFLYYAAPRDAAGHWELSYLVVATLSGLAILAAAFLLSWGAEVAQLDMAQSLALVILSLIAILPEYSVDMAFAWSAGKGWAALQNPATAGLESTARLWENRHYAVANMTGANRILIGIAWSAVVFLYYWRTREKQIKIESSRIVEMKFLLLATIYSFTLPLKAALWGIGIHWVDALVLVSIFGFYVRAASQTEHIEPELMGPPASIAALQTTPRRLICLALFIFSAWVIFLAAHPFAESLVEVGKTYRINEFLLVQWIAPLASEMPEFIVAGLFAWRGFPAMGMGTLISSKVNQWTLLVGLLPVVFGLAAGHAVPLPLDGQQRSEVLLTSAQSLYAVAVLLNFRISVWEAAGLLGLFLAQFITQFIINMAHPATSQFAARQALILTQNSQLFFSVLYIGLAFYIIFASAERRAILGGILRRGTGGAKATVECGTDTDSSDAEAKLH